MEATLKLDTDSAHSLGVKLCIRSVLGDTLVVISYVVFFKSGVVRILFMKLYVQVVLLGEILRKNIFRAGCDYCIMLSAMVTIISTC